MAARVRALVRGGKKEACMRGFVASDVCDAGRVGHGWRVCSWQQLAEAGNREHQGERRGTLAWCGHRGRPAMA